METENGTYGNYMMHRYTVTDWILLGVEDIVVCAILAAFLMGILVFAEEALVGIRWIRRGKKRLKWFVALSLGLAQAVVAYFFVTEILPDDGFPVEPKPVERRHSLEDAKARTPQR